MLVRFFSICAIILLFTACSSTNITRENMADKSSTQEIVERYQMENKGVEPFAVIKNSNVENRRASDRVFFAFDSSVISKSQQKTLDDQVTYLKSNSTVKVTIEGHCDERGTREYNLALGERRAQAVKNYLVGSGISANRVTTISYGKERQAVVGSNSAAWAENRRGVTVLDSYK